MKIEFEFQLYRKIYENSEVVWDISKTSYVMKIRCCIL